MDGERNGPFCHTQKNRRNRRFAIAQDFEGSGAASDESAERPRGSFFGRRFGHSFKPPKISFPAGNFGGGGSRPTRRPLPAGITASAKPRKS